MGETLKEFDPRMDLIPCSALLDGMPFDAEPFRPTPIDRDLSYMELAREAIACH